MLGGSLGPVGATICGSHWVPEDQDHGTTHEGHADQHGHVEDEGPEDAAPVHHPVLPQVSAERQVLDGSICSEGNVALRSRGDEQRQSHEKRHQPGKGDEGVGSFSTEGFVAEWVADGHVAFKAKRCYVHDGGVAAGLKQEVVDLTGDIAWRWREREPDGAVELHRHTDEQHQKVWARQTDHVVGDVLLQVAVLLKHLGHSDSDWITHNTRHQHEAVKDGQEDFDGVVGFKLPPILILIWYLHFLTHSSDLLFSFEPISRAGRCPQQTSQRWAVFQDNSRDWYPLHAVVFQTPGSSKSRKVFHFRTPDAGILRALIKVFSVPEHAASSPETGPCPIPSDRPSRPRVVRSHLLVLPPSEQSISQHTTHTRFLRPPIRARQLTINQESERCKIRFPRDEPSVLLEWREWWR